MLRASGRARGAKSQPSLYSTTQKPFRNSSFAFQLEQSAPQRQQQRCFKTNTTPVCVGRTREHLGNHREDVRRGPEETPLRRTALARNRSSLDGPTLSALRSNSRPTNGSSRGALDSQQSRPIHQSSPVICIIIAIVAQTFARTSLPLTRADDKANPSQRPANYPPLATIQARLPSCPRRLAEEKKGLSPEAAAGLYRSKPELQAECQDHVFLRGRTLVN